MGIRGVKNLSGTIYDTVVAGAGPAGLCAAVASARNGAKTAIVERFGTIGGNLTVGHVGPIMGRLVPGTMAEEINRLLNFGTGLEHNKEYAKIVLNEWLSRENVELFLLCPVAGVIKSGDRLTGLVTATAEGLAEISGKVFVDATGDGTVAYLSGAPCEYGREGDGLVQPASIMFTVDGVSPDAKIVCRHEEDDTILPGGKSYLALCREACASGELPPTVNIVRLYKTLSDTERMVNATQANGVNGLSPGSVASAERELRAQMKSVLAFLKKNVPGFENCRIMDSSDTVGIRETRRVIGEYVITGEDLMNGASFDDAVVRGAHFPIDIHNPSGAGQAERDACPYSPSKPYDLPYRSLVPLITEGLLTCGRCISGDHRAHASYRVMNTAMMTGEAAGTAAALCAITGVMPRYLDPGLVREKLGIGREKQK